MSRTAMNEILDRSMIEEDFRSAILADPDGALADYDLTDAERAALTRRDVDEATKLAGRSPVAAIVVVNVSNLNTFITSIVTLENLIATRPPDVDERDKARIRQGCDEIKQMDGDRTEALKELLATMW
jgi:hypothetical protein